MSDVISISILRFFAELNDPRQTAKILYPLPEIILVALCAAICGADSFVEMEEFGNAKLDFLRSILPFENGIPGHDTFGAVFANLDSRQFNEIFIKWVLSLKKLLDKYGITLIAPIVKIRVKLKAAKPFDDTGDVGKLKDYFSDTQFSPHLNSR